LQTLIQKNLKIDRVKNIIDACHTLGILTRGFFMIGFPTETVEEIGNTIRFAVRSRLTFAGFFLVIPQEGTPIFEWAKKESPVALKKVILKDFYSSYPWYQLAYGINLRKIQRQAYRRFYLRPWRLLKLARFISPKSLFKGLLAFLRIAVFPDSLQKKHKEFSSKVSYHDLFSLPEPDDQPMVGSVES
jgi:radical SAM superfamily enzyme YgiQ (UPF0313 family)